ncbi:MAG: XdhC/CoxI family protein [Alphaproteobacteria bacterium HGW-Alphaproteobacteria-1]|jgi:xanthine dehydrogenase accessory factor|nr:MAG: XdhC/CoxI family protein [Alphaproteobacteria bacterium HGW-Alphaproteobacteria-1]
MNRFDNIPEAALDWHRAGKGAALATVVETWGSAPRRVGSQLAISGAGEIAGSVSGGCVEGAVVVEALDAMAAGRPVMLEYGVSDGDAFAVGLACGGTIRVLVEPVGSVLPEALLAELVAARAAREAVAYVTGSAGRRLERAGHEDRFRMDRSGLLEDGETFVAIHNPPLRLIIVGAVHIAQALVPMARTLGYDPVVIDPRESFASPARFPDTRLMPDWPDEAVAALGLDARTALVLLTHDPKLDDPALMAALRSEVFYIGALGSTRTHGKRVVRLAEAGFSEAEIARVHGPVGLDIGAAGPAEIAVSILAEMTRVLRRGA